MKHFIFILFGLIAFSSCQGLQSDKPMNAEERSKSQAKAAELLLLGDLKEKYQESFVINEFSFAIGLNNYEFYASPEENERIKFYGNYDERQESPEERLGHDSYPNAKFTYAASTFYQSLFQNTKISHVASADVYSYYMHTWGEKVPSWDEYLNNRHDKSTISMNTYYFEVPQSANHPIFKQQKKLLEELHAKYSNNFSLYIGFWPQGFLEDKNLEELTFGFQSTSEKDADNILNVMQYLSKVLWIKIVHSSIEDINEDQLFDLMKDDNKNGINEMKEI